MCPICGTKYYAVEYQYETAKGQLEDSIRLMCIYNCPNTDGYRFEN